MMQRINLARFPFDPKLVLWGSLVSVLAVGMLASMVGLMHTGETLRANTLGQRAVGDPKTGNLTLAAIGKKTVEEKFDVAAPEPEVTAADPHTSEPTAVEPALPGEMPALRTEPLTDKLPDSGASAADSLVPAPAPEISETLEGLTLPKRGEKAFAGALYAKRFARTPEQHLLSIVVLDAGISAQALPILLSLPKQVTVAFSPYTADTAGRIATLRRAGYESWGMLPAMTTQYPQDDPGPLGLVGSLPKDELMRRLRVVMAETIGSAGMVLPLTEALSSKRTLYTDILTEIDARGLYLLAANPETTPELRADEKKRSDKMRRAHQVIEYTGDDAAFAASLAALMESLKTNDEVTVITSANPENLLQWKRWLTVEPLEEPVVLAPLSAHWLPKEPAPLPEPADDGHGGGHGGGEKKDAKKSSGGH